MWIKYEGHNIINSDNILEITKEYFELDEEAEYKYIGDLYVLKKGNRELKRELVLRYEAKSSRERILAINSILLTLWEAIIKNKPYIDLVGLKNQKYDFWGKED